MTHIRGGNQDSAELAQFCAMARREGVTRYLEIGSQNGDSFDAVMRALDPGAFGMAVDLPRNSDASAKLAATIAQLNADGIACEAIYGNSREPSIFDRARGAAPFDLVLIDADHRYAGAKADFESHGRLGRIVALHDVAAPEGHLSDGYPNEIARLWREVSAGQDRVETIITPGSMMGFGIVFRPAAPPAPQRLPPAVLATPRRVDARPPEFFIEIPAWGKFYVDLACRYTIPALLASLSELDKARATFLIHTDDQNSYKRLIGDRFPIRFLPLLPMGKLPEGGKVPRLPDNYWVAFKQAHKDGLAATPMGAVSVLLNSDVVVSRECFPVVAEAMARGKKVVASVGIRTDIDNSSPPVGVSADELFRWIWDHPHPITKDCIWGKGRSHHPTILFFEEGENVSFHGYHLTPMFVRKTAHLKFRGTIDDDLLGNFADGEIEYLTEGQVAFAELSPLWKTHPSGQPLSVAGVLEFWARRAGSSARGLRACHQRNFRNRMRVLGNPTRNHPAADQIIAGLLPR